MISYRGRRLTAGVDEFHQAVDLLAADTRPRSYAERVWASQYEREQASHPSGRSGATNPQPQKELT
jgi:hypothetical protein